MSKSNDELNTDHSTSIIDSETGNTLFAGVNKSDDAPAFDSMSLHELNTDQGENSTNSSDLISPNQVYSIPSADDLSTKNVQSSNSSLENFANSKEKFSNDQNTDEKTHEGQTFKKQEMTASTAIDGEKLPSNKNITITSQYANIDGNTEQENNDTQTLSVENVQENTQSKKNMNHDFDKEFNHIVSGTANTFNQKINTQNIQSSNIPQALLKANNNSPSNFMHNDQSNDVLSMRSLPSDPAPKLPEDVIKRYKREHKEDEVPLYYAPGEPLSGKPGDYFKKIKQAQEKQNNIVDNHQKLQFTPYSEAMVRSKEYKQETHITSSSQVNNTNRHRTLADKSLFANVSINRLHNQNTSLEHDTGTNKDETLFKEKTAIDEQKNITQRKNNTKDKTFKNKNLLKFHEISIKSSIFLYIRQFIASFFTHTNLGVLIPKAAEKLGPCYPSSMPFPCFFTGFISALCFFYLLNEIMPNNDLLWASLSTLLFFILSGCCGFSGIVKICSALSNTRTEPSLHSCVCVLYILIFTVCFKELGALHGNALNGSLVIGCCCMLASAASCSLEYGLTDDPVDSFGSITPMGLIFTSICSLIVVFLVIPPLVAISMCGIAILMRLIFGAFFERRSIMISRSIVCGMYLNVLIVLMLYLILAAGRSLI